MEFISAEASFVSERELLGMRDLLLLQHDHEAVFVSRFTTRKTRDESLPEIFGLPASYKDCSRNRLVEAYDTRERSSAAREAVSEGRLPLERSI